MAFSLTNWIGGLSVKDLATRVYAESNKDDIWGRAAQLSYYFLLALFPLLLFLISVLGAVVGSDSQMQTDLFRYLGNVLPPDAAKLVQENVKGAIEASGGGKISFGILAAIWAASNGMGAISDSLNAAYDVEESRSWIKGRIIAIGLTIALAVLIITALILMVSGHDIASVIAKSLRLGGVFETVWGILQYPLIIAFVLLAFGLIYYFAPNVKNKHWAWVTPGAILGVILWLLVSFAFTLYLNYFDSYSKTYGSLGAVIVLMLWFYLTGLAILIGGEINSEVEHAAAERGDPTAKESGEKSPQEKSSKSSKDKLAHANLSAAKTSDATLKTNQSFNPSASKSAAPAFVAKSKEPLSIGKVALVAGTWFVKKLTRRN